jgi:hypothetical protein
LLLLDLWLAEWSNSVPIERSYIIGKGDAQPLALDLDSSNGPQPAKLIEHSASMRYLITAPLSKLLRVKTILLQQGETPKKVKLGGKGSTRECIGLLTFLHQCWCEDNMRFGERNPGSQQTQLCYNPEIIHALLSGKEYKQKVKSSAAKNIARKQLEAFGQVLQDAPGQTRTDAGSPLEIWQFENESILGARLTRVDTHGGRLSPNQLVALHTGEEETFKLGATTWVSVTRTGQLHIGVRYLPGMVHAIGLHMAEADAQSPDKSAPGFQLQAVPALKTPASLIIPRSWFKAGRVVDIRLQNGEEQQAKMGFSVERGIDYERVSFTLV